MRKIYMLFLLTTLSIFSYSQKTVSPKYFEGTVEYNITTHSYMAGISDNELRERTGNTLKVYFKNGSYMREYFDGAGYTLRKVFYSKEKDMMYDYYPILSPDTLYLIDPTEKTYESFSIEKGGSEKILDCESHSILIKAKYLADFLPDTGHITMTYYFCEKLPVDPEWHKTTYIWNEVIKYYKSISIKFIEDDPNYMKQIFTATNIMWESVSNDKFSINPELYQKKIK